jgi:hypothetical protein
MTLCTPDPKPLTIAELDVIESKAHAAICDPQNGWYAEDVPRVVAEVRRLHRHSAAAMLAMFDLTYDLVDGQRVCRNCGAEKNDYHGGHVPGCEVGDAMEAAHDFVVGTRCPCCGRNGEPRTDEEVKTSSCTDCGRPLPMKYAPGCRMAALTRPRPRIRDLREEQRLRAALEAVEWSEGPEGEVCAACERYKDEGAHRPDCKVAAALGRPTRSDAEQHALNKAKCDAEHERIDAELAIHGKRLNCNHRCVTPRFTPGDPPTATVVCTECGADVGIRVDVVVDP